MGMLEKLYWIIYPFASKWRTTSYF